MRGVRVSAPGGPGGTLRTVREGDPTLADAPGCICKTERDPFKPCPVPAEAHQGDVVEVISGPDDLRRYFHVRWWWDASRRRQRAQCFFDALPDGCYSGAAQAVA
jgi:hypothetical protein